MAKNDKTIAIKCETKDRLNIAEMTELQGTLKKRTDIDFDKIKLSIIKYGFSFPFFVWNDGKKNYILDGHGRFATLCKMQKDGYDIPDLPVVYVDCKDKNEAKQKLLRLNSQYGHMTKESVLDFAEGLDINFGEIALPEGIIDFTVDNEDENGGGEDKKQLTEEFLVPPLSILDTTQGYWQERKKIWKSIGLKSDEGRDDKMMKSLSALKEKTGNGKFSDESIFDPVLCETLYSWFGKPEGQILDPFAGGSVRGVIASFKNMKYIGFDIRPEQIEANEKQKYICDGNKYQPVWMCCDSNKMDSKLEKDFETDMVFSCPPYADLEVYSDLDGDISNMNYKDFIEVYKSIISKSCSYLKNNRFAVFVICEVRDKKGFYYNFVSDTIKAFEDAGCRYYNEIILKNGIGTKALTCGIAMRKTRKVGKIHQNVLVFCKGDPKKAVEDLGDVQIAEINVEESE